MHPLPRLAIIIPCYNEEESLRQTATVLGGLLDDLKRDNKIAPASYLLMVDDGSKDTTWAITEQLCKENTAFCGLKLSRNFGHQPALLAGLHHVDDADAAISMDADLQHDPLAVIPMLEAFKDGAEIVYGVRKQREGEGFLKRKTGEGFYRFLRWLGADFIHDHADYRLMGRRALDAFKQFREVNLYLRGMVPLVGFRYQIVTYEQRERFAGSSKYNLRKMLAFAWNGVSSLSVRPLHLVTVCGFVVFFISLAMSLYALIVWAAGHTAPGWASTVLATYFLGGVQLLCIGLIGEYVGKIYKEVKARPRYIIEESLNDGAMEQDVTNANSIQ